MSILDQKTLKNEQDEDSQNNPVQAPAPSTMGRTASFNSGLPSTQKGSGRFINLQKYINANQGAGENIANKMGRAVTNNYDNFSKDFTNQVNQVNSGIDQGNKVLDEQGNEFKSTLGNFNTELGSFNSMTDRDRFDAAGSGLIDFQMNKGGAFNNIRTGNAIDEVGLGRAKDQANELAKGTIQNIQNSQQSMQTEDGRYDLLNQVRPKLQNYTQGQGRLDQLFFQASPDAVNNLQNTYATQLGDAQTKQGNMLSTLGSNLSGITAREKQYMDDLSNLANQTQDTFYNKLNQSKNFQDVNNARTALYNDYINQIKNKQISQDLAETLGVNNMGGAGYSARYMSGMDGGKMGSTKSFGPAENQFTMYNTGVDPTSYINQNTRKAENFQDLLTKGDYNVYQALQGLSGRNTGKAYGTSEIGPAVLKNPNYAADLQRAHQSFLDNYTNGGVAGKNFQNAATAESHDRASQQYGKSMNDLIGEYQTRTRAEADAGNPDLAPQMRAVGYDVDVDKYVTGGNVDGMYDKNITGGWYPSVTNASGGYANQQQSSVADAYNQLKAGLEGSGVRDLATLTGEDTTALDQYKRFKGLL